MPLQFLYENNRNLVGCISVSMGHYTVCHEKILHLPNGIKRLYNMCTMPGIPDATPAEMKS